MLKNKVDKLVLKAFLEMNVPECLRRENVALAKCFGDDLRSMANRLLMGRDEKIEILQPQLLSKEDKAGINNIITGLPDGDEKRELVFFYRLAILVETLLYKYRA